MKKVSFIVAGVLLMQVGISQTMTVAQYIQLHKDFAIKEMKRMGVPAAVTLAQGILETEAGNSELVKKSNNHFGIKCKSTWTAATVSHDDDAPGECFRCYEDAEGSYRDHSNFLRGNERYAFLFKLDPADYKGWCYGLKKAGYATNPNYPKILIRSIEEYNLQQYSLEAAGSVPFFDASKYTSDPEDKDFDKLTKTTAGNQPSNDGMQFENKIMINGAEAIFSQKGTSLLAIATQNNINLLKLLEYNDLDKDGLLAKDQLIYLEKKSREGEEESYVLQQNETLYDVAQKKGIRLQSLYDYNALSATQAPVAGNSIRLRPEAANPPAEPMASPALAKMHSVQPKEGLYAISKKYGVTIAQIKEWNKLPDDNIKIGQQLIISSN